MGFFRKLGQQVEEFKRDVEAAAEEKEEAPFACAACGERLYTDSDQCPSCGEAAVVEFDGEDGPAVSDAAGATTTDHDSTTAPDDASAGDLPSDDGA